MAEATRSQTGLRVEEGPPNFAHPKNKFLLRNLTGLPNAVATAWVYGDGQYGEVQFLPFPKGLVVALRSEHQHDRDIALTWLSRLRESDPNMYKRVADKLEENGLYLKAA